MERSFGTRKKYLEAVTDEPNKNPEIDTTCRICLCPLVDGLDEIHFLKEHRSIIQKLFGINVRRFNFISFGASVGFFYKLKKPLILES